MELRDLIVTPLLLIILYAAAYMIRPYVTDSITRKYFLPGLSSRIVGAVALGLVYQNYYGGGDTFSFHTHGSRIIWDAFADSMQNGFKLLFSGDRNDPSIFKYASQIYFYRDPSSLFIIRLATLFDLVTFSSYSATAVLFSTIGFIGSWMFFLTFYRQYPQHHRALAVAALFIPSVIFWGSGLLKDTITLGCLGIATYQIYKLFLLKNFRVSSIVLLLLSLLFVFIIKKFILQAFLPAAIIWVFADRFYSIRSIMVRILIVPLLILTGVLLAWYSVVKIGEGDSRYSVDQIARTARITAYDIRYWSGRKAGSGYSIGVLDDSFTGMLRLAPQALNVALFRPYLWEVNNPFMLLSAIESLSLLLFCLWIIVRKKLAVFRASVDRNILFCLSFSVIYAFAVGVSTYNFGTLARYKVAMLPFLLTGLVLLHYSKSARKTGLMELTE